MILHNWEDLPKEMQNEQVRPYYDYLAKHKMSLAVKFLLDKVLAAILLLILSPIFLAIAIWIKCDSAGERETRTNTDASLVAQHPQPRRPALASTSRRRPRRKPAAAGGRAPPYLKFLIPRETRELSELQLNACHLSHRAIRGPSGWVSNSSANVYIGVWNLRGCSEGRH
jgi:hypothetical protein